MKERGEGSAKVEPSNSATVGIAIPAAPTKKENGKKREK